MLDSLTLILKLNEVLLVGLRLNLQLSFTEVQTTKQSGQRNKQTTKPVLADSEKDKEYIIGNKQHTYDSR